MDELKDFWDAVEQQLTDTKAITGIQHIVRGSMGKKPPLQGNQATTWVELPQNPLINISSDAIPLQTTLSIFITGKSNTNIHQTHLKTLNQAFKVAFKLQAFKPLPTDAKNSGCILQLDRDQSFQVVEANPQAYTVVVVFNTKLVVSI